MPPELESVVGTRCPVLLLTEAVLPKTKIGDRGKSNSIGA